MVLNWEGSAGEKSLTFMIEGSSTCTWELWWTGKVDLEVVKEFVVKH